MYNSHAECPNQGLIAFFMASLTPGCFWLGWAGVTEVFNDIGSISLIGQFEPL